MCSANNFYFKVSSVLFAKSNSTQTSLQQKKSSSAYIIIMMPSSQFFFCAVAVEFSVSMVRLEEGTQHTLDLSILKPDTSGADPQASLPLSLLLQRKDDLLGM